MAKGKGKKLKNNGLTISQPDANKKIKKKKVVPKVEATNAVVPTSTPLSDPAPAYASAPTTKGSRAAPRGKEEDENNLERLPGFIFMCNGKTKPECYQNRVFGLPAGRREDVEKIKPGVNLFLFDFDLKLLYGVYKATSSGKLNLESAAFGGKFPAQVSFKIYKECLPLPESALKHAIQDIYQGHKFKSELNGKQVKNLLSLFRPFPAPSAASMPPPMPNVARPQAMPNGAPPQAMPNGAPPQAMPNGAPPQAMLNAAPPQAMPPPALKQQLQPSARLPFLEDPYLAGIHHVHAPPVIEPQPVRQRVLTSQHEWYGTTATMDYVCPTMEQQRLPAPNDPYYFAETRQPYLAGPAQTVPDLHPRYRAVQEMVPHDRVIGLEGQYHWPPLEREGEIVQQDNIVGYYNSHAVPVNRYGPPLAQLHAPASRRTGFAGGSAPVSSFYSFAGATQKHR